MDMIIPMSWPCHPYFILQLAPMSCWSKLRSLAELAHKLRWILLWCFADASLKSFLKVRRSVLRTHPKLSRYFSCTHFSSIIYRASAVVWLRSPSTMYLLLMQVNVISLFPRPTLKHLAGNSLIQASPSYSVLWGWGLGFSASIHKG